MEAIDTPEAFEAWLAGPDTPAVIQSLDLTAYDLCSLERPGTLFLACTLETSSAGNLVKHGAIVVPDLGKHFTVHRARLYAAEELYAGYDPADPDSFARTPDQQIYREYLADSPLRPNLHTGFARATHDHSISDALDELIEGERVVAFMGGHGLERSQPRYAQVARLAKALTERGYLITSGGGPGAMEASHLGAWLAGWPDEALQDVLSSAFTRRPDNAPEGKEYADSDWLARAWQVRLQWPRRSDRPSVGIPTWLYGHEPPTPFATHIAKYFANSIREDGVLAIATHGVVFARGSAGTTQEIFQDACQNHYATTGLRSPMVLLDRYYWIHERPVWPLLEAVSRDEIFGELVSIADTDDEVLRRIQSYEPAWYGTSADPDVQLEADLRRLMRLRSNWVLTRSARVPAEPADWRAVLDWLHALGDDDWIDRERGARVLPKLFEGVTIERAPSGIIIGGRSLWTAVLND